MAVNHLVYQGRLTRELELKKTQSGIEYVNFDLAWSEKYKETERQCFLPCKAWRQTASFMDKYMHDKGTELIVEGQLETEKWQDKDGGNRSRVVLTVDKVHFCGKKQSGGQAAVPEGMSDASKEPLPF